ncbi:STAS domain-containing protein [Chitinivorax sp. B]|uniref:STAS domain-containing protein n=1 Tax=Chitinivorax sp. B TaxID=2502235 RepID=UPI0010F4566F|nr:STAS domain-containing protein [Chitinivorax sp. B]
MRIPLSGSLTYREAVDVLDRIAAQLTAPETILDMSGVDDVDSSAVALLLAWARRAREQSISIRCEQAPDNVLSLAALYGADGLLALSGRQTS